MAIRKRGNSYQVIYRCSGESTPRTETYKSEEEAIIRDAQIRLAKREGTFEPPIRAAKGVIKRDNNIRKDEHNYAKQCKYSIQTGWRL